MAQWQEPKSDYVSGSLVTPQIFNELAENEKYLKETQDNKIGLTQVQEGVINSEESTTRLNLLSSEQLKVGFGKIRKWFSDLRGLAFRDSVGNAQITDVAASKVTGLHAVGISGSYADLTNKPSIPNADGASIKNNANTFSLDNYAGAGVGAVPRKTAGGFEWLLTNQANGIPILDSNSRLTQTALRAVSDENGNNLYNLYLRSSAIGASGGLAGLDANSRVVQVANSAVGDEYGYRIYTTYVKVSVLGVASGVATLDSAGKLVATQKATYTKSDVGLSNVDNVRQYSASNPPPVPGAGSLSITPNANLGNTATVQDALNYIANVFGGTQTVSKIKANIFDAV